MITYDAAVVSAHMRVLQTLVPRVWPGWGGRKRRPPVQKPQLQQTTAGAGSTAKGPNEPIEQLYSLDLEGFWTFYHEALPVLQEEHPELSSAELRLLIGEHWWQYKMQLRRQQRHQQKTGEQHRPEQQKQQQQGRKQDQQEPQQQQRQLRRHDTTEVWPLLYSRHISGRLLLRLEYVMASGLQAKVRV